MFQNRGYILSRLIKAIVGFAASLPWCCCCAYVLVNQVCRRRTDLIAQKMKATNQTKAQLLHKYSIDLLNYKSSMILIWETNSIWFHSKQTVYVLHCCFRRQDTNATVALSLTITMVHNWHWFGTISMCSCFCIDLERSTTPITYIYACVRQWHDTWANIYKWRQVFQVRHTMLTI